MTENTTNTYTYKGRTFASERDMVRHLLDEYRCVEGFAAQYLGAWQAIAEEPRLRGGLRTVCGREQMHAEILEARLRELGGTPQCTPPPERVLDLAYYSSAAHSDLDKLEKIALRLQDPEKVLSFLTQAIDQITEDRDTCALLSTILADERASIGWFVETWKALAPAMASQS
ncbi:MAG: ferritin-like domain-containing protein [Candidatus Tectomicrobia bacterium]|uniref:Ferritin-like domain-containing protein n=1 Tax=Tectimicrobiota bacterium TaxID=2528274 RepID=A0A937W3U6_UNCTE|nr:ferritin-like domain-containing protein [Candidatus Tectomicrobia bacterium]